MKVFILGAGPAGMALADGLVDESNIEFVVIERGPSVGGLAQTLQWKDHGTHDLGPHKIFTLDQNLLARVKALLTPQDWLVRPKTSRIFMGGKYLPYPPSPFSLLSVYGPIRFAAMVIDYGLSLIRSQFVKADAKTFEEDLQNRVGNSLYTMLFKPLALKLWGDPRELDAKLSRGRVQTPSIKELLLSTFKKKKESSFEALDFIYPKGGLQRLWNRIVDKATGIGQGTILLNTEVTGLSITDGMIRGIRCLDRKTSEPVELEVGAEDMVFSTLPLGLLPAIMGPAISDHNARTIEDVVRLNDLLLVFFKIDKAELLNDSWIFIPDPAIAFHRVSEQKAFDPQMTPRGSIVCCEIMSNPTRPMAERSDSELIELAKAGLQALGYKDFSVEDQRVIRLPRSYPVFRPGFESALEQIFTELDSVLNFRTIGRQGAFNYIGTLDCMDIGYGAAEWLIRARGSNMEASWHAERKRTSFYPVLD